MGRSRFSLAPALVLLIAASVRAQETAPPPPPPVVRAVHVTGANQLSERESLDAMHVRVDEPLPEAPDRLARAVERRYDDAGYTFAQVTASFDDSTGTLSVSIDEGVIGGIEFQGVPERMATKIAADFALRVGDVFNREHARQALRVALAPTRGAVTEGKVAATFTDSRELPRRRTFDMVERDGQRILIVGLRQRDARFRVEPDFGDREDWFTPVDGLVPSLGFGVVAFDHEQFNHTFIAGHISLKLATGNLGYSLGFERPLFAERKLYVGGELHDFTASDDTWQVSSTEASVASVGVRKNFRDYYGRRGVQITGAWRLHPRLEILGAWRGEHQRPLGIESDFSLFNGDEAFRPNRPAQDGQLNAIVVGATLDSDGFERESLEATYRRHQLDTMFGDRLPAPAKNEIAPIWRVDWTSEISTPGALGSDFDFRRHIVSARLRTQFTEHQEFGVRAIGGWSGGTLPPQRQFAAGGIGSVHGYDFKDQIGDTLALVNLEYAIGWRNGARALGFFDIGRATLPAPLAAQATPWLKGVGFGFALGDAVRIDFGYRVDAAPSSLQVLLRFGRTF